LDKQKLGFGVTVLNQTVIALFFALLIFYAVTPSPNPESKKSFSRRLLHQILAFRFLKVVGKYSYAIYIFHGLLKHLWMNTYYVSTTNLLGLDLWIANLFNTSVVFAASMLLAMLSWVVLEKPFLTLKRYTSSGSSTVKTN